MTMVLLFHIKITSILSFISVYLHDNFVGLDEQITKLKEVCSNGYYVACKPIILSSFVYIH